LAAHNKKINPIAGWKCKLKLMIKKLTILQIDTENAGKPQLGLFSALAVIAEETK